VFLLNVTRNNSNIKLQFATEKDFNFIDCNNIIIPATLNIMFLMLKHYAHVWNKQIAICLNNFCISLWNVYTAFMVVYRKYRLRESVFEGRALHFKKTYFSYKYIWFDLNFISQIDFDADDVSWRAMKIFCLLMHKKYKNIHIVRAHRGIHIFRGGMWHEISRKWCLTGLLLRIIEKRSSSNGLNSSFDFSINVIEVYKFNGSDERWKLN
jgi:hypothetical protein